MPAMEAAAFGEQRRLNEGVCVLDTKKMSRNSEPRKKGDNSYSETCNSAKEMQHHFILTLFKHTN